MLKYMGSSTLAGGGESTRFPANTSLMRHLNGFQPGKKKSFRCSGLAMKEL